MTDDGKRSEVICTKVSERVALDLLKLCALEDRSVSDLVHLLIRRHLYGHLKSTEPDSQST